MDKKRRLIKFPLAFPRSQIDEVKYEKVCAFDFLFFGELLPYDNDSNNSKFAICS